MPRNPQYERRVADVLMSAARSRHSHATTIDGRLATVVRFDPPVEVQTFGEPEVHEAESVTITSDGHGEIERTVEVKVKDGGAGLAVRCPITDVFAVRLWP